MDKSFRKFWTKQVADGAFSGNAWKQDRGWAKKDTDLAHETWRAGGDKWCDKVRGGEIRREDPIQLFL